MYKYSVQKHPSPLYTDICFLFRIMKGRNAKKIMLYLLKRMS